MVVLSKLWLCQRLNESVFILIEDFYLTEISFRCSPGKWMSQVFVFYPESTVAFTQTIQPFVLVYFRFIEMYVCA